MRRLVLVLGLIVAGCDAGPASHLASDSTPSAFLQTLSEARRGFVTKIVYCDPDDAWEMALRSPIFWLGCVKTPLYVFEGSGDGNWDSIQEMADRNSNPNIQFFRIAGHDHFSVIAPLAERLADQIVKRQLNITPQTLQGLR